MYKMLRYGTKLSIEITGRYMIYRIRDYIVSFKQNENVEKEAYVEQRLACTYVKIIYIYNEYNRTYFRSRFDFSKVLGRSRNSLQ